MLSDRRFCQWCTAFLVQPSPGTMAGLFGRRAATWLDVLVPVALIIVSIAVTRNAGAAVLGKLLLTRWICAIGVRLDFLAHDAIMAIAAHRSG